MERKDREKKVAPSIRRLDHMMARNLEGYVKEQGMEEITLMHGWIIRYLYVNQNQDVFQKDIEKQFGVGRSTVTNIIQLMEKKEYLKRETVGHDARLKKLVLTEKGIQRHEKMECLIHHLNKKTVEGISDEELDIFFRVLDKLEANIMKQKKEGFNASDNT